MTENEKIAIDKLHEMITQKGVSNEFLVQLIEVAGGYLNIKTIPDYAKYNNLTYNGVKKTRQIKIIFNTKFVIDNE